MTEPTYIPLRLHTEFSITDGMVRIKKLIAKAQEYGLPALGISDLMNEFGLVKFYKACRSAGIKPVGAADVWIGNPNAVHTFTFTPDAARAVALLGTSSEAYGQTWHLPTTKEALTGADFVRLACDLAGRPNKLQVAPRWMLKLMGLFMPVLRENDEMLYQFEYDYRFDSSKIESAFGLQPTPYIQGIGVSLKSEM